MNRIEFIIERYRLERAEARDFALKKACSVARTREEMLARIRKLKGLNVKERETAANRNRKLVTNR